MAQTIRIKRGTQSQAATGSLSLAEFGWTTDTKRLYIGDGVGKTLISAFTGTDKINEGDSKIEIIDTGTGYATIVIDNSEVGRWTANGLTLKSDILPDMTGGSGYVSTHSIGASAQRIKEIYTEHLYSGSGSIYIDGNDIDDRFVRKDEDSDVLAHTEWQDNYEARFGNDNDLQIYHDGSDSYIDNITGNLNLRIDGTENGIVIAPSAAVDLYYNNAKKFETTNIGATITGDLLLTGFADGNEPIIHILNDIINQGVLDAITITADAGVESTGLNISWTVGHIWDYDNNTIVNTVSASAQACTDDAINYLYWSTGIGLTLSTTAPTGNNVHVGEIHAQDGAIWGIEHTHIISERESGMSVAMGSIMPGAVTDGLIVSEHAGANAFDIDMTQGVYYLRGHEMYTVPAFDSTVTNLVRWFHDGGGNWDYDTNSQIDNTQYDTGTGLTANIVNQYYRSTFFVVGTTVHWIYPRTGYANVAQAVAGECPAMPGGLEHYPKSTCVVLKGNATALPAVGSDQWIDYRPRVAGSAGGIVSDHGNLAGLTPDDDHPHYLLTDGSRTVTGSLTMNGLSMGDNDKILLGNDNDLQIYHSGTHGYIDNVTGSLYLRVNTNENAIVADSNGAVELYYDASKKFQTITTGVEVLGNCTVIGNLTVSGSEFITYTEHVSASDNLITINAGASGSGVAAGYAGIEVDRGDLVSYRFFFDETDDNFQVGEVGDLQAVATREDTPQSTGIPFWNSGEFRFDTSPGITFTGNQLTLSAGTGIDEFSTDDTLAGNSDDAVPTEKAVKTYVDNAAIFNEFDPTPPSDHSYSGVPTPMTVGENVAFGDSLYIKSDEKLWKTSATDTTKMPCVAIALETITGNNSGEVLIGHGFLRDDSWNWTVGASGTIYVDTTLGALTQTAPTSGGEQVQIVGFATHADRMFFNTDYVTGEID